MTDTEALLKRQWSQVRGWLNDVDIMEFADEPSGLPPWSVRDLVAHLGFGIAMLAEITPAPSMDPIDIGRYVAGYVPVAEQIADATQQVTRSMPNVLDGIDEMANRAWQAVAAHDDKSEVVLGRRGPLTWEDYLLTRLIELTIHGDDLARAIGLSQPGPVLAEAWQVVAQALASAYQQRTGNLPEVSDPEHWVRLAAGRVQSEDPALPLL